MAITVPNTINNITSSQIVTQSGQACVPANLLDANFQALANPVNPVISVTGSISLSTSNSGNIYELNAPSANATITLPTPTNGFNAVFVGNNSSSYTYTFSTPSGNIIWNNTTSVNATPNTTSGVYFLVSDGANYLISYKPSAPNSISVTGGDLTMGGTTGANITNATLVATGVTAGTYGSNTQIPQITFDSKGRATSAINVSIFVVRAWAYFNATTSPPTIYASGNVSSVVKNAAGSYTVNFTVALPSNNYVVSGSAYSANNVSYDSFVSCDASYTTSCAVVTPIVYGSNTGPGYDSSAVRVVFIGG
jgi:hypothetical protein